MIQVKTSDPRDVNNLSLDQINIEKKLSLENEGLIFNPNR